MLLLRETVPGSIWDHQNIRAAFESIEKFQIELLGYPSFGRVSRRVNIGSGKRFANRWITTCVDSDILFLILSRKHPNDPLVARRPRGCG